MTEKTIILTTPEALQKFIGSKIKPWIPIDEAMDLLCLDNSQTDRKLLTKWMNDGYLKFKKFSQKRINFHRETILQFMETDSFEAFALKKRKAS